MNQNKIVVITGAGISVESGIKPFRGTNGIWNENPTSMATYAKFTEDPAHFLSWYYERFVSCKDALPNATHEILAKQNIRVITQNVDNLHKKARHPQDSLIEIHGHQDRLLKSYMCRFQIDLTKLLHQLLPCLCMPIVLTCMSHHLHLDHYLIYPALQHH